MNRKRDTPIDFHGPSSNITNFRRLSAIKHAANYEPLPFLNTPFPAITHTSPFAPPSPLSVWRTFRSFILLYVTLQPYFKTQIRPSRSPSIPTASIFTFRRRPSSHFRQFWIIGPIVCLSLGIWYCYEKLNVFMRVRNEFWGFSLLLETSQEETRLPYYPSLSISKKRSKTEVYEKGKAVWVLAKFLSDDAKKGYESYTANGISAYTRI